MFVINPGSYSGHITTYIFFEIENKNQVFIAEICIGNALPCTVR